LIFGLGFFPPAAFSLTPSTSVSYISIRAFVPVAAALLAEKILDWTKWNLLVGNPTPLATKSPPKFARILHSEGWLANYRHYLHRKMRIVR
jgi:hypothetical protein